ncbi:MAG: gamma-glutamylcyclotransferase [Hyphomicrobiales bacterium]|nr:gamma-glutamylcyclotransferase [Hyphomicrobiales bacterium]
MHKVFIYGTLKQGFPNHGAGLTSAAYVGRFRTVTAFPLVVGGKWFSPYLLDEPGQGQRVYGEVFQVSDDGLATLDRMEGTDNPLGYRRISVVVVAAEDGTALEAWTDVKDRAMLDGIHSKALAEYGLDPRYVVPAKRMGDF